MIQVSESRIREFNDFMQSYRIFCATKHRNSEKMWAEYAGNHQGVMIRIEPNEAKDSKFKLFKLVEYAAHRPSLYRSAFAFISEALYADQETSKKAILDKIVYTKTLDWEHEGEYRLAIPVRKVEEPWDILPFHPEEVTELYLGASMRMKDLAEIVKCAKALNPSIRVYQALRDAGDKLFYEPHY